MEQHQDLDSFTGQEGSMCPAARSAKPPAFYLLAELQNIILLQDFPHWDPTKNLLIF